MAKVIKSKPKEDDCHCGKPLRINDPIRKKIVKVIKKK